MTPENVKAVEIMRECGLSDSQIEYDFHKEGIMVTRADLLEVGQSFIAAKNEILIARKSAARKKEIERRRDISVLVARVVDFLAALDEAFTMKMAHYRYAMYSGDELISFIQFRKVILCLKSQGKIKLVSENTPIFHHKYYVVCR